MDALVVPAAAAILLFGLVIGWFLVRRWRPSSEPRPSGEPVPDSWHRLIDDQVPLLRRLTGPEWIRLLDLVHTFVREKHFEGVDGLAITEEMKVVVAAQACLLVLHLDAGVYPRLRSIILYPGTFVPRLPELTAGLFHGPAPQPEPTLGEYRRGAIVLSWESVVHDAANAGDGRNVVLHEFAHQLDQEDGYVDGIPLLEAPSSTREWTRVLKVRFEELRRAALEGEPDLLSAYGATNRAEFFAVATETFFERPIELRSRYPDLYRELKGFYRQDPADVPSP
jgi:Mlc titration factor MtfA (ptsG expression regulator)